jgi:hypothetical protein
MRLFRDNDGEYLSRVIRASDGIRFVPEARSYYRQAGFSSISYIGNSNKKLESLFLSMKLHIGYLLSLEDSQRTRDASVFYIRTWLPAFYPYRMDIADELKRLTLELGGRFDPPRLPWKYNWILKLFGWRLAKRAQLFGPRVRKSLRISWDEAMFHLENRAGVAH